MNSKLNNDRITAGKPNGSIISFVISNTLKEVATKVPDGKNYGVEILIDGSEITLTNWSLEDKDDLVLVANNEDIASNFVGFPYPYTEDDALNLIGGAVGDISLKVSYKGELVGGLNCEIKADSDKREGIISYWVTPDYHKKGIGLKSVEQFISYLFLVEQFDLLEAYAFDSSTGSQKILSRLGFLCSGKSKVEKDGKMIVESIFVITKERFERIVLLKKKLDDIKNTFTNYEEFINDFLGLKVEGTIYKLFLRDGGELNIRSRAQEVSDIDIVFEIFIDRDYSLDNIINLGDTVVDIGGQVGLFSCYASQFLGDKGRLVAFEPFSDNFEILKLNSSTRPNVAAVNKGISSKTGDATLYISKDNVGGHSMIDSGDGTAIDISTLSINDLFETYDIDEIDLLKIDCEGEEYNIFESISDSNIGKIKRIYMEVHYNKEISKKYDKYYIMELLIKRGYTVKILKEFDYEGEGEFYIIYAER